MKKIKNILSLSLFALALVSCDPKTASQDVSEVGDAAYKPKMTVTPDVAMNLVNEGDVITYTITTDKTIAYNIDFTAILVSGTAGESDVVLGSGTIPRYTNSTSLTVEFAADLVPELDETAVIKIIAQGEASDFWITPHSADASFSYTIKSPVDPSDLIVALEWDYNASSDLDMFSFFGPTYSPWDLAATGDTPEVKNLVWGVDPDGTYYFGIDPYDVEPGVTDIDYKWIFGSPDGSIQEISGTFDYANRDTVYTTAVYSGTTVYLLAKVVKTGLVYVATPL